MVEERHAALAAMGPDQARRALAAMDADEKAPLLAPRKPYTVAHSVAGAGWYANRNPNPNSNPNSLGVQAEAMAGMTAKVPCP